MEMDSPNKDNRDHGDDIPVEAEESKRLYAEEMKEEGVHPDSVDGRVMPGYGAPYKFDPEFRGPIHNRSCTDIICCFFFVVFILGMVVVSAIGFARGDPKNLVYPTDSSGGICGTGKLEALPFLVFFDLNKCATAGASVVTSGCPTPQVCVKECPKKNWVYLEAANSNDRSELICRYYVDHGKEPYKSMSVKELVDKELCAAYYLESDSLINRCVPKIFSDAVGSTTLVKDSSGNYELETADGEKLNMEAIFNGTKSLLDVFKVSGKMEMVFKDVVNSAHLILIGLLIAALIACLWIVLLRWITFIMVWLTILFFVALVGFASVFSYIRYYEMKNLNMTHEYGLPTIFKDDFEYFLNQQKTWLAFGCTTATIFFIFVIIIIFLCSRISLAINLISEASIALSYMWSVLFWPIFPFILQFLVIGHWIISSLFIASMGEAQFYNGTRDDSNNVVDSLLTKVPCDHENGTVNELCSFVKYGGTEYKNVMMFYQLFMFFWLMNFVSALEQMTLAGSFASYYWTWDKQDMPTFPVWSSLIRSLRYHLGSLAFGSLIIAIVQLIRAILEYINRKLKSSENDVAKFILKCLRCCFWCLEKFLRFVNKNAYIIIAVHGNNFCSAAKEGFFLIMRNCLRAAVLDKVCDFIMFISKLMVAAIIGVLSFFWFQGHSSYFEDFVPKLNYYLVPVILAVIGAYVIADCFFDVYSMGVDTLFMCFLEDLERNDGSQDKPYYMSKTKNLRHLLLKR